MTRGEDYSTHDAQGAQVDSHLWGKKWLSSSRERPVDIVLPTIVSEKLLYSHQRINGKGITFRENRQATGNKSQNKAPICHVDALTALRPRTNEMEK